MSARHGLETVPGCAPPVTANVVRARLMAERPAPGASRDAWAAWLDLMDVEYPAAAGRDELVALADAEVVEHRTGDGRVVARYSVADHVPVLIPPGTAVPGWAAAFVTRAQELQAEGDRITRQAATGQPATGLPATRRARAAAWTYSPADARWPDIVVEAPFAAAGRYWEWNKRVFARLAGHQLPLWWMLAAIVAAAAGVGNSMHGIDLAAVAWYVCAVGAIVLAFRSQHDGFDDDHAMVAAVCADLPERAPFTWRDVDVVPFASVCVCPSCDTLALHWLAAAEAVPEHDTEVAEQPLVWRQCAGPCGLVWPQLR